MKSVTPISESYSPHLLEIRAFSRNHVSQKHEEGEQCIFDSPVFLSCTFFS